MKHVLGHPFFAPLLITADTWLVGLRGEGGFSANLGEDMEARLDVWFESVADER